MSENQSSAKKASEPRTAPVPRVESAQAEATVTGAAATGAATQGGAAKASDAKSAEPISAAKAPEGVRVAAPASGDKASQKADKKAEKKATREAFARPKSLEEAAKPQNRAYGVWQVLGGIRVIPDAPADFANPSVQSNYVFFAATYVGVGLSFVFIAVKFKWVNMLAFSCLVVFLGGVGRILSWAFFGTPHWSLIVLMVTELVIPPCLLVWYGWINKSNKIREEMLKASRNQARK